MNPKFILKDDMIISLDIAGRKKDLLLFNKGEIFESNENGEYIIDSIGGKSILTEDGMISALNSKTGDTLFDVFDDLKNKDIEVIVEEVSDDDDNQVKRWRIQLDISTTRKKLRDIEKFVNDSVKKML